MGMLVIRHYSTWHPEFDRHASAQRFHERRSLSKVAFAKPNQWLVPFVLAVSFFCSAQAPLPEPVTDLETQLGQQMYNELKAKGEIVETSPLYDSLKPLADSISKVAQSRYPHPFKFFIVHEPHPNAFATRAATSMSWIPCSTSSRTRSNWRERCAMKPPTRSIRTVSSSWRSRTESSGTKSRPQYCSDPHERTFSLST